MISETKNNGQIEVLTANKKQRETISAYFEKYIDFRNN